MSLVKILLILTFLLSLVFSRDTDYRRGNRDDRNRRRKNRHDRRNIRRIEDDAGNPVENHYRYENEPPQDEPTDIFNDIKRNGRIVYEGDNHAQYEEWLDDSDIYEILSEEGYDEYEEAECDNENNNYDNETPRRLVILGADTRFQITGNPITSTPSRYVGRIRYSSGGETFQCSAASVGSGWILTAGHCVHEGNGGSWFTSKRFYPRMNNLQQNVAAIYTSQCHTFNGWTNNGDADWDFALCKLQSVPSGTGYSGFGYDNNLGTTDEFYIRGYPGDKPLYQMWASNDELSSTTTYHIYCDECDTFSGMSGGPWVRSSNSNIYGTHKGGSNRATRINKYKYDWMCNKMPNRC